MDAVTTNELLFWFFVGPWLLGGAIYAVAVIVAVIAHGISTALFPLEDDDGRT